MAGDGWKSNTKYIVGVDVGTTVIRAVLFDHDFNLLFSNEEKVEPVMERGAHGETLVEINPDILFEKFVRVVKATTEEIPLDIDVSLAIATQRNSIVIWNLETKKEMSPVIFWNDGRANNACRELNESILLKAINYSGFLLHAVTRKPRFLAARRLKFLNSMSSHRIMNQIQNSKELQNAHHAGKLAFGALDAWLRMRLSDKNEHMAEASSISSSGMFDPWIEDYNHTVLRLIGFPLDILSPICGTTFEEAKNCPVMDAKFSGRELKIHAMVADQQAAMFGCGAFEAGDVKVSLGTGTFVGINTGKDVHASLTGIYPLVGWRLNGKSTFLAEGNAYDTSTILNWAQSIGLFTNVEETSEIAESVPSSNGVFFVPALCGLQVPINDELACCGFLGIKPDTKREHLIRAILDSIVFRVYQIFSVVEDETAVKEDATIRICGGVSQNNFICQSIADVLDRVVVRYAQPRFSAARGAVLLAALGQGFWTEKSLKQKIPVERKFKPRGKDVRSKLLVEFTEWEKAVKRCAKFYE